MYINRLAELDSVLYTDQMDIPEAIIKCVQSESVSSSPLDSPSLPPAPPLSLLSLLSLSPPPSPFSLRYDKTLRAQPRLHIANTESRSSFYISIDDTLPCDASNVTQQFGVPLEV